MRALFISVATAAIGGMLMGAAIRPRGSDLHDSPVGPQIIASGVSEADMESVSYVANSRRGPIPEYVIGTDWTRPKSYEVYVPAIYEVSEAERYIEPAVSVEKAAQPTHTQISYSAAAPSAAELGRDAVETLDDGGGQSVEVVRADDQGRGQVDDLAHGSNPGAEVSEPAA
jgi:hypothetical protein